jgi:anti-sigma regulatory factor (Ser/Thr protein kinase)
VIVTDQFRHEAFIYRDEDEFLAGAVPFIRDGMSLDEPTLVAVDREKAERIRAELGADSHGVEFADMRQVGRNPARILPVWREFVREHTGSGRRVRGIGEPVWPGRSPSELTECRHHESLLNLAFDAGAPWWLLCPYDATALDEEALRVARECHPYVAESGTSHRSDAYRDPFGGPSPLATPLSAPPPEARAEKIGLDGLAAMRANLRENAIEAGLSPRRAADLVLAVNELVTNSIRHGSGAGTLRTWHLHGAFYAEVSDDGRIAQPLIGSERPTTAQASGRGLWMVHQLCDLVQLRSGAEGTVVRVEMALDAMEPGALHGDRHEHGLVH